MTIKYNSGDPDDGLAPYYETSRDPSMQDLDNLINIGGNRQFFNFIVTGTPKRVSPEWLANHPGWDQGEYEYAVSYSIYADDVFAMADNTENPLEALNYYLEGTGKEWVEIDRIRLVEKDEPWEDTY